MFSGKSLKCDVADPKIGGADGLLVRHHRNEVEALIVSWSNKLEEIRAARRNKRAVAFGEEGY
jgi:hypothetical protein